LVAGQPAAAPTPSAPAADDDDRDEIDPRQI
jgi:hypothetical protein